MFPDRAALEQALDRGCPEERAVIVEPPILVSEPDDQREREDGPLRVLSAGPLVWEQGFEHSIQAIRMLLDRGVPCEYRIIGDDEHDEAVAFARHELGLHDHVQLVPQDGIGQLPEELRSADVFLDPAVADTIPSAPLIAAQAHGVPYVATARPAGLVEGAGITVPRRDPRPIAEALSRLASDPEARARMGRRASTIEGLWLLDDHLGELEGVYRTILTA